jgi:GDP-L-fucose synthase
MKKVLITGKTGTVGSNLHFGIGYSSKEFDLRDIKQADTLLQVSTPDAIVHCAAKVGGLKFHLEQPYQLFYDNILINTNLIECAKKRDIPRVLSFLSSCIFSESASTPYTEEMIHAGPPFQLHYPYGFAKRALEVHSRICFEQTGLIYNCLIPTNIYGIHDDFNLETGHVVGVLIHKAYLAYKNNTPFVVWGDGNQEREFIFTEDMAKITEWALNNYKEKDPLIVSTNQTVKIKEIAEIIAEKFGIQKRLVFDTSKPSGQKVRSLCGNKLSRLYNFNFTPIDQGIHQTIDWFLENYPKIRL